MKRIFLKILSIFSLMCMFMLHANTNGNFSLNKLISFIRNNRSSETVIPIAMATDNNYAYPTIVAMSSILKNRNPKNRINFYIMLSGDFDQSLKNKIKSLESKYEKCSISFIDMKDKLKNLYTSGHIKTASYYRLLLPDLLPDLDKILYMDVDTITQYDLSDLFNVNVDNYYFAGISDKSSSGGGPYYDEEFRDMFVKRFGGKENLENTYVNAGILLFNLKKMRKDGLVNKLVECASYNNFNRHDQDVLNYVCYNKIKNIDKIFNCAPYLIDNINNQIIIHYMCGKPWSDQNVNYSDIWWRYAKETGLEKEIKEKFLDKSKMRPSKKQFFKVQKRMNKAA